MRPDPFASDSAAIYDIRTRARGPEGALPLSAAMLRERPSGDLFGLSQNAGMGWAPDEVGRTQFLILSTQGGVREPDGRPVALGYHTGHWEIGLLVEAAAAAAEAPRRRAVRGLLFGSLRRPHPGHAWHVRQPALPQRRRAWCSAASFDRCPVRAGVLGVATCDKGLPAMMMALAGTRDLPAVLVPGGVTLPPEQGEDAATIQTIGARFSHGLISLQEAAELGCRACASPGGGCQFLGTAATSQVVGEALGLALPHSALAPSGQPVWTDLAGPFGRCADRARGRGYHDAADPVAGKRSQRHGRPRRVRRVHEPSAAHSGHRARGRPATADRGRLDCRQPRGAASGRRPAERPDAPSDGARLPGRRRARSDAAPPRTRCPRRLGADRDGPAARRGARCLGGLRAPPPLPRDPATAGRRRSR